MEIKPNLILRKRLFVKTRVFNFTMNIGFLLIIIVFGICMFIKYKYKPSKKEKHKNVLQFCDYIVNNSTSN